VPQKISFLGPDPPPEDLKIIEIDPNQSIINEAAASKKPGKKDE
jgi:hypothetical protein